MQEINPDLLRAVHRSVVPAVQRLRLPFRRTAWRGKGGNWSGTGIGTSIDFQDYRPYQYGDDLRHIDWNAYARMGVYVMKLYREEVSPAVDVAFDCSPSMFFDTQKAQRSLELLYFAVESALRTGSAVRIYLIHGNNKAVIQPQAMVQYTVKFPAAAAAGERPALAGIEWRAGSMRVLISDLLFSAPPEEMLLTMAGNKGRPILFVPFCNNEAAPAWDGNICFQDCESLRIDERLVDDHIRNNYLEAYRRHFDVWRDYCRRIGIPLARVGSETSLSSVLLTEALPAGAVEACN